MKLSIVTICYNDLASLKATMQSLAGQTRFDFEHWVIDGGSTDGTREYLASFKPAWDFHFVSEKDRGIYNAMNKGIQKATGDFAWFLNAGDLCAEPESIANWLKGIDENPQADLLYGKVWYHGKQGYKSYGSPITKFAFWKCMAVCHQGVIYRRTRLLQQPYRENLRLISDWVLTEWFFVHHPTVFLNHYFAIYSLEGVSSQHLTRLFWERFHFEKNWIRKVYLTFTLGIRFHLITFLRKLGVYVWIEKVKYRRRNLSDPRGGNI